MLVKKIVVTCLHSAKVALDLSQQNHISILYPAQCVDEAAALLSNETVGLCDCRVLLCSDGMAASRTELIISRA
jgi:hypothetical protein